jgi:hypothetical protein
LNKIKSLDEVKGNLEVNEARWVPSVYNEVKKIKDLVEYRVSFQWKIHEFPVSDCGIGLYVLI